MSESPRDLSGESSALAHDSTDNWAEPEEEGGDPACWLDRVCAACGRLVESGETCPACGAQLGSDAPSSG